MFTWQIKSLDGMGYKNVKFAFNVKSAVNNPK